MVMMMSSSSDDVTGGCSVNSRAVVNSSPQNQMLSHTLASKERWFFMTEGNFSVKSERLQNQNVVNIRAGPATFAASRITEGLPSFFISTNV